MAANLTIMYDDTTVFYFDTNTLFNQVIDDPKSFKQTAGYKDTADRCQEYYKVKEAKAFDKKCGISYKEYLWHDALHPTFPIQEAIAAQVVSFLIG